MRYGRAMRAVRGAWGVGRVRAREGSARCGARVDFLATHTRRYDVDGSRTIDKHELPLLFADLHEKLGPMEIGAFLLAGGEAADSATPGAVGVASGGGELLSAEPALSFEQFVRVVIGYIKRRGAVLRAGAHGSAYRETEAVLLRGPSGAQAAAPGGGDDDGEGDGEEEAEADDEMPDELRVRAQRVH